MLSLMENLNPMLKVGKGCFNTSSKQSKNSKNKTSLTKFSNTYSKDLGDRNVEKAGGKLAFDCFKNSFVTLMQQSKRQLINTAKKASFTTQQNSAKSVSSRNKKFEFPRNSLTSAVKNKPTTLLQYTASIPQKNLSLKSKTNKKSFVNKTRGASIISLKSERKVSCMMKGECKEGVSKDKLTPQTTDENLNETNLQCEKKDSLNHKIDLLKYKMKNVISRFLLMEKKMANENKKLKAELNKARSILVQYSLSNIQC
jgi:hypothetical protein